MPLISLSLSDVKLWKAGKTIGGGFEMNPEPVNGYLKSHMVLTYEMIIYGITD